MQGGVHALVQGARRGVAPAAQGRLGQARAVEVRRADAGHRHAGGGHGGEHRRVGLPGARVRATLPRQLVEQGPRGRHAHLVARHAVGPGQQARAEGGQRGGGGGGVADVEHPREHRGGPPRPRPAPVQHRAQRRGVADARAQEPLAQPVEQHHEHPGGRGERRRRARPVVPGQGDAQARGHRRHDVGQAPRRRRAGRWRGAHPKAADGSGSPARAGCSSRSGRVARVRLRAKRAAARTASTPSASAETRRDTSSPATVPV